MWLHLTPVCAPAEHELLGHRDPIRSNSMQLLLSFQLTLWFRFLPFWSEKMKVSWQTTSDENWRRQERPACLLWAGLKFQSEKLFVLSGLTVFHQKLLEIWRVINSSYFISWDLRLPAQVQGFLQGWERKDHSQWNCCVLDSLKNHKSLFLVAEWNITLTCFLGLFLILK